MGCIDVGKPTDLYVYYYINVIYMFLNIEF